MRFAFSYCLVAFVLCYVANTVGAHPLNAKDEKESDSFNIVEIDPSVLANAKETQPKKPARYVTAIVRNKRNFDFLDYLSSSSEEGNSFEYRPKPYYQGFGHFWKYHRPTATNSRYQFWQPQPTLSYYQIGYNRHYPHHHYLHRHDEKNCKYPFDDSSNSSEYGDSGELPISTISTKDAVPNIELTTKTPSTVTTPTTTTSTTSTTTTTTEYIPVIDIRSAD